MGGISNNTGRRLRVCDALPYSIYCTRDWIYLPDNGECVRGGLLWFAGDYSTNILGNTTT
jgi:hypothetical protein